jgi:hypothetical protein
MSAFGTFGFSLVYGYLQVQELIRVMLCNRKLGLFLALKQFARYTVLSYFFRRLDESTPPLSSLPGRRGAAVGWEGGGRLVIPVFRKLFFGPKKQFLTGFLRISFFPAFSGGIFHRNVVLEGVTGFPVFSRFHRRLRES